MNDDSAVSSNRNYLELPDMAILSAQHPTWITASLFWIPGWNFTSIRAEHLPFHFWLVDAARPQLIVDLVSGKPDSYLAFCQSLDRLGYTANCLGTQTIFGGARHERSSLREYHDRHFAHLSHLVSEPAQLIGQLRSRTIDLLHIDGRQASEFSEQDARSWLARLSPQGLILVNEPEYLRSPWIGLLEKRASFVIGGTSNLQLSVADPVQNSALAPLFDEAGGAAAAALMRAVFARLGVSLSVQARHRDLETFSAHLEVSLAQQSAAADLLREENARLGIDAQAQAVEKATLATRAEEFGREVSRLHEHAGRLEIEIRRREGWVNDRDGEIERLRSHTGGLETEVHRLGRLVADRDQEIKRLEDHAQGLTHQNDTEISRLQQLAADREGELQETGHRAAELSVSLQQSQQSLETLQRHAARLEHDVLAIMRSTTWRATAPVRWFFGYFPGPARLAKRGLKSVWWVISLKPFPRLRQDARRRAIAILRPSPASQASAPISGAPEAAAPQSQPTTMVEDATSRMRVWYFENRIAKLESIVDFERHRTDFALLGAEGFLEEIDLFHRARAQSDYQKAFSEDNPLVSVCVATMNRSDLVIERCLKSLIGQTYRNIQINVVGDHCTDDTGSRIALLRDDRISFRNLAERGPYPPPGIDRWRVAGTNAMNAALSMCEGQFVAHLDEDDSAAADRIETLVNAAQQHKADMCWHSFWYEGKDGAWSVLGNGRFELGQITTGSIFYHRYFTRFPWDVRAYRIQEPGDWNRLRKLRLLRPNLHYIDRPLMFHYVEDSQRPFVRLTGESFLE